MAVRKTLVRLKKRARRYLARPALQDAFRVLYRVALAGMNYGGAASALSSGDGLALARVKDARVGRGRAPIVFDVGANIGSYVAQVLRVVGADATVYAFEPSATAFDELRRRHGDRANVHLVRKGIGATSATTTLWSAIPGSVLASTYTRTGEASTGEAIDIVTLDEFCDAHGIERIDLLKLDVEGGEVDALRGAERLLERNAIDLIQFEFGQPSLMARTFFADLFELLIARYTIHRVLPDGLVPITAYHETLEVFMSTNYLAVARDPAS